MHGRDVRFACTPARGIRVTLGTPLGRDSPARAGTDADFARFRQAGGVGVELDQRGLRVAGAQQGRHEDTAQLAHRRDSGEPGAGRVTDDRRDPPAADISRGGRSPGR